MLQNKPVDNERVHLERVAAGDQKSFAIIFAHYSKIVYPFSLKLTRSESLAQEILQDVFLKIWTHRERLLEIENFGAYLNRVTRNHCFNVIRRLAHETLASAELTSLMTEEVSNTEEYILAKDLQESLNNAVNQLTPQQKLVYTLCHQDGLKYDEAADRLNLSRSTVHSHMKLALRLIRKYLIQINILVLLLYSIIDSR